MHLCLLFLDFHFSPNFLDDHYWAISVSPVENHSSNPNRWSGLPLVLLDVLFDIDVRFDFGEGFRADSFNLS